jgi:hypothetical protein
MVPRAFDTIMRLVSNTDLYKIVLQEVTMASQPNLVPFIGVQCRQESTLTFDRVLEKLRTALGTAPVSMRMLASLQQESRDLSHFEDQIMALISPCGLLLFEIFALTDSVLPAGHGQKATRLSVGHPSIILSMYTHDPSSFLHVSLNLLLVENVDRRTCTLTYVVPSTLLILECDTALMATAKDLDRKLSSLVHTVLDGD